MKSTVRSGRNSNARRGTAVLLSVLLICASLLGSARTPVAHAGTFSVGCSDTAGLIAAIAAANASGAADTITLAAGCTYTLSAVNNTSANGPNGLPVIFGNLAIVGNGATIARDTAPGTSQFRLIEVVVGATLRLNDLTISNGNLAANGGGIFNAGNTTLTNVTVSNNDVGGAGGGAIYNPSTGTLMMSGSTITGNTAGTGSILNDGALTIDTTTVSNNTGTNQGGGVLGAGTVTITRSTFANNVSRGDGGALWVAGGIWTITNVTVTGNSAGSGSTGGGLVTSYGGPSTVIINNSTFVGNSAVGRGGNIDNGPPGSLTLRNTIVANPGSGVNCAGNTTNINGGNNLQFPGTSCVGFTSTNPQLGPLQNNGGSTQTFLPAPASPAINAGNYTTCAAFDQRGVARPQGPACDIGAVEVTAAQVGPVFTVTNSGDAAGVCAPGACSLRAAIALANASQNGPLPDTIQFRILTGTLTITPLSPLPVITNPVIIDGYTQPGASPNTLASGDDAVIQIELNGDRCSGCEGLVIAAGASGTTVRGLAIHGNFNNAIQIEGGSGSTIAGNFLGLRADGTPRGVIASGMYVNNTSNNMIGGTTPAARNVIAANRDGIFFAAGAGNNTGNVVQGNYIGTNPSGTAAGPGNRQHGIFMGIFGPFTMSNNTIGGPTPAVRNVISGNLFGIRISAGVSNTSVQGNYIGTNATGTAALGSGNTVGVFLDNASNNTIGGTTAEAGNVISGNTHEGVLLQGSSANGNLVQGNYIGTDANGAAAVANGFSGVNIIDGNNNVIGGTAAGARNVISGNQIAGVSIQFAASGNIVQGNYIGVAADGTTPLGNTPGSQVGWGVVIVNGNPSNNSIGGTASGAGNVIAYNAGPGAAVYAGTGNRVQRNAIFANGTLGIDLGGAGVTPNDSGDGDAGPNNLQNFPAISSATIDQAGNLIVQYSVDSTTASSAYPLQIELFKGDAGGQGRAFIVGDVLAGPGARTVNLGSATALGIVSSDALVATATDNNGNTSEFSPPVTVTAPPPPPSHLLLSAPLLPTASAPVGTPSFAVARSAFDIVVTAVDVNGAVVANFNGPVTLGLRSGTGGIGAALSGTTIVNASGGIARFSNLSIDPAASGYQLLASANELPTAIGAPFDVLEPEVELNDVIGDADLSNQLALDASGRTARAGTIFTGGSDEWADADWFVLRFVPNTPTRILPGATMTISLTNLPADYDLALVSDPRVRLPSNDGTSLTNITDAGRSDAAGQLTAIGESDSIERVNAIGGRISPTQRIDLTGQIVALSTNRGSADESIQVTLAKQVSYYILVYSGAGAADPIRPYRLDVSVQGGTPPPPLTSTQPVNNLNVEPNPNVRTIFLYDSARMAAKYPSESAAIARLVQALTPGPANKLMQTSSGASIDLSGPALAQGDRDLITRLYTDWDNDPSRADRANQVAQQIWNVLDRAIAQYYPNTTDLVLVGGDDIIPFYRVPDETVIGNESQYYDELHTTGALIDRTPLAGSLGGSFIQTDDFYADRQPTEWRGRALYVPDLGSGRLVEDPIDIMRYLDAYADGNYTIAADQTTPGQASAALVSGYDFVSDEADAIRDQLVRYGFPNKGTDTSMLRQKLTLNLLNSNDWTVQNFKDLWFHGPSTPYQLASLNGHFSHYAMGPAVQDGSSLDVTEIADGAPADAAYFKNALIYSIGCHAGLSASNAAFNPSAPDAARLQADFADAILKQGGNWVANTGFAFGDNKSIGYSERLALLFTEAIGRQIKNGKAYGGAPIGESLARAKRHYIQEMGPGGFGVADEKVVTQMTLYGLPFIRVKVPNPTAPLYGDSFDPPAQDIPPPIKSQLPANQGLFTRVITVTNSFDIVNIGGDQEVRVHSKVLDDVAGTTTLTSADQMAPGRPVLPALTYDITLNATKTGTNPQYHGYAQPRGVRLRSATTVPDMPFNPQVTTPVTQQTDLQHADPPMTLQGEWIPDLPYTFQRTAAISGSASLYVDKLIISPAQFNASNGETGQLRRFEQMVFEVSYVDPATALPNILPFPQNNPTCNNCHVSPPPPPCRPGRPCLAQQGQAQLSAEVSDYSGIGLKQVSATYTTDGKTWQRVILLPVTTDPTRPHLYQVGVEAPPPDGNISVFFEAIDNAGNVTVSTSKGTNGAFTKTFLPIVAYPAFPDLVGSIGLSPDKRTFQAGEPVQITVTITNTGSGDAGPFWVDLFINPSTPPTQANVTWNSVCGITPCFGLAWQVSSGLKAGTSIQLTSKEFPPGYSVWPGWFARGTTDLYLYVDSYNPGVALGAVLENNEGNNQFHLGGLTVSGPNPPHLSLQSAADLPARPAP